MQKHGIFFDSTLWHPQAVTGNGVNNSTITGL